jgi:hypothetical protein
MIDKIAEDHAAVVLVLVTDGFLDDMHPTFLKLHSEK